MGMKEDEYIWVKGVIQSCENVNQIKSVMNLVSIFNRKHKDFRLELLLGGEIRSQKLKI